VFSSEAGYRFAGRKRIKGKSWGLCFDSIKAGKALKQDEFSLNRHPALAFCLSMIFSENRFALFGIML
jgi:hypothetical protein